MIKFLLKGIIRDKSRSLLPIMVISIGVFLTVFMSAWMKGIFEDLIDLNANFTTGHVKIETRAYAENESQMPNDLALLNIDTLIEKAGSDFPEVEFVPRIQFGCLLDIPDSMGETRAQGPGIGKAIDMLSPDTKEIDRLNLKKSLVQGEIPTKRGEALVSDDFVEQFGLKIGDKITIFGSTMEGSMMFRTFDIAGTVRFGIGFLDRGAIIIDVRDGQEAMDMDNAASEILGFFKEGRYDDIKANRIKVAFNQEYSDPNDEFSPIMKTLKDQNELRQYLELADNMSGIMVFFLILAMSIVLWNAGLLGGLRRYYEFGIRLALGEDKSTLYRNLIYEAVIVGSIGSIIGTILGLAFAFYMQEVGLDISSFTKDITMMIPTVYRAKVTPELFYIGFIPGLLAMVLGTALAGLAIYKRDTSRLFKELGV